MNNLITIVDDKNNSKKLFFEPISKSVHFDTNNIKDIMPEDKILIVFSNTSSFEHINKKIKKIKNEFLKTNILFLIPDNLKQNFEKNKNCITFPIKINELINLIKKENNFPMTYKNTEIKNNILRNINSNKTTKLSDIEKKILQLLFFKESIKKEIIKISILQYKTEIKSNSVDSHLSRLRNKIQSINSDFKIASHDTGIVSLD